MATEGFYLVQGDKTTCGGRITTGAEDHTLFDKPVARERDRVTCGKDKDKEFFEIAGGIDNDTIHDRRMAGTLDSYSTCPCKATFIPSMMDDMYEKTGYSGTLIPVSSNDYIADEYINYDSVQHDFGKMKNVDAAKLVDDNSCDESIEYEFSLVHGICFNYAYIHIG